MDIKAINDVLALVAEATNYKKQLETLKKEQERVLELYGNAKDLREAKVKADAAKSDRAMAKSILDKAQATADEIIAKANTQVVQISKEATQALAEAVRKTTDADALKTSYTEGMKSLEGQRKALEERTVDLHKKEEEVEGLQKEVLEKLAKLKSVMG